MLNLPDQGQLDRKTQLIHNNFMHYHKHILPNGIRLVHQSIKTGVAHCGLILNTGSRDEARNEHGLAHFIEHLMFKGTRKRNAYHIANRMESVGGEINAFTTKEETCVYAAFLKEDYERPLELISDIVFNSCFPEKEIEKEKLIVLDEINSFKDSPADLIFDDFEEIAFRGNPVGRSILGNKKSIGTFTKAHITGFVNKKYNTDQIIVSSVGNIAFDKFLRMAEKHFGPIKPNYRNFARNGNYTYSPVEKTIKKNTYQTHCILGNLAFNAKDKRRVPLILLNNILGGPGFNSKLNYSLREKFGFAYTVESNYHAYSDTGIFTIYFGSDKNNVSKSIQLIHKEISKLTETKLTANQLRKAKKQLIGQIAIYSDNNENLMVSNGRNIAIFDKIDSFGEVKQKIEDVTETQLQGIALEVLDKNKLSTLIYE